MIPWLSLSQTTGTQNNNKDIYLGLIQGDYCRKQDLPRAIKIALELNDIVQTQNDSIEKYAAEFKKNTHKINELQIENAKKEAAIQKLNSKKSKPYGISIYTGYGIDLKPNLGIGISYSIFRF